MGFNPPLDVSAEVLRISVMASATRVIGNRGIEFETLYYRCPELAPLRHRLNGEKVTIKYDPGDISSLYVWDAEINKWIEVPAVDQEYAKKGLSLYRHLRNRRLALEQADQGDRVALAAAHHKINVLVQESDKSTKAKRSERRKAKRLQNQSASVASLSRPAPADQSSQATNGMDVSLDDAGLPAEASDAPQATPNLPPQSHQPRGKGSGKVEAGESSAPPASPIEDDADSDDDVDVTGYGGGYSLPRRK
jgi:putative transposase